MMGRFHLTVQPLLSSKFGSAHPIDIGAALRSPAAKLARVGGATLFLACAVIFTCDLLLGRPAWWELMLVCVGAIFLFWLGRKIESSSSRTTPSPAREITPPLCRRRFVPDICAGCPQKAALPCECQPWQCQLPWDSGRRSPPVPESVAAPAREYSQEM